MERASQSCSGADYRTAGRLALLAMLLAALTGCGQDVQPGRTHHRLYSWSCPRAEGGKAFLVLRYSDQWVDASKSTRVGLIKFRTSPQPSIFEDRYIWGMPIGADEFVLFDAMRNRVVRRTDYVRQIDLSAESGERGSSLLAFALRGGSAIEVVRPDGSVVIAASAGYAGAKLAFARPDGTPVLAMTRPDGQTELRAEDGGALETGPLLTTLQFDIAADR